MTSLRNSTTLDRAIEVVTRDQAISSFDEPDLF